MRQRRRLITLISAGRNCIVMIGRELPRTEDADWRKAYRTKLTRILLPHAARPAACCVARRLLIEKPHARPTEPAMASYKEIRVCLRRDPSRPSGASRREALTGPAGDTA